jgi:hypothetical protein
MGGEDTEDSSWLIYTMENMRPSIANPGFNSLGCFDSKNSPVVRLRWTDRDLVATTAD